MHYIIYGAGGVGGCIGARLHIAGHQVTLIARGAHLQVLRSDGLRFISPDGDQTVHIPTIGHPSELSWQGDEVVLFTMKSQHSADALQSLRNDAPDATVVCAQNGVANERLAAELFKDVVSMVVWLPAVHLEPGVVVTHAQGRGGILDCGLYPTGMSDPVSELAQALDGSGFSCRADPLAMRWKYAKLLSNLGNALEAMIGDRKSIVDLHRKLRTEALACYAAAGIDCASAEEVRERLKGQYEMVDVEGYPRSGGSTWQGIQRGADGVETPYLNGETVMLGQKHQVETPANSGVLAAMQDFVAEGAAAGTWQRERLLNYLPSNGS